MVPVVGVEREILGRRDRHSGIATATDLPGDVDTAVQVVDRDAAGLVDNLPGDVDVRVDLRRAVEPVPRVLREAISVLRDADLLRRRGDSGRRRHIVEVDPTRRQFCVLAIDDGDSCRIVDHRIAHDQIEGGLVANRDRRIRGGV